MELGEDENILRDDYQNYVDNQNYNPSFGTGKNETGAESHHGHDIFEKFNDIDKYYPQTELRREDKKEKVKTNLKRKKSVIGNSSKDLDNILNKKTSRDEKIEKKKKNKSEMDFTLKYKTEINYEEKKKENEKKIYELFNQEAFYDVYGDGDEVERADDLFELMNNDNGNPEVNQTKSVYTTQINYNVQETFNMILSSQENK